MTKGYFKIKARNEDFTLFLPARYHGDTSFAWLKESGAMGNDSYTTYVMEKRAPAPEPVMPNPFEGFVCG